MPMLKFYLSINYVDFRNVEEFYSGSVTYQIDHISINTPCNRRPGVEAELSTITIHNSNNPSSTARNERNWLSNEANAARESFHIVIDEKVAIEAIPLNEIAWHIETRVNKGNQSSIAIVICESGDYEQTLGHASQLVAHMLYEREWEIDRLRRHYDWNGRNCPRKMNADGSWSGWDDFVAVVEEKLSQLKLVKPKLLIDYGKYNHHDDNDQEQVVQAGFENGGSMMSKEDANKIILFLNAAAMATSNDEARGEFNRLANELRKISGQDPIDE